MGLFESAKGKLKLIAGGLSDNQPLKAEGEAQASKGAEERKETEAKAKAQLHEKKAETYDAKQAAAEQTK